MASASPRRAELLKRIFAEFEIVPTDIPEVTRYARPHLMVMDIAAKKAQPLLGKQDSLIISADTAVVLRQKFFAKPVNRDAARQMLLELSGKWHSVYTGVSISFTGNPTGSKTHYAKSRVKFKKLTAKDIEAYIETGSPFDKAGGYGIQDNCVVDRYTGSYENIMGLPVNELRTWLK